MRAPAGADALGRGAGARPTRERAPRRPRVAARQACVGKPVPAAAGGILLALGQENGDGTSSHGRTTSEPQSEGQR